MKKYIKRLDHFLDRHVLLFLMLALVILLRIPNFSEPYWYGDEGIYLTIGQSLNHGLRLYAEIIDHKTPLIYLFAQTHTQLNFRLLFLGWMLATTTGFYLLVKKFSVNKWFQIGANLLFVLLTTLPWLEGNIPNGELFVMGFIIWGGVALSKTEYWQKFFDQTKSAPTHKKVLPNKNSSLWLIISGLLFSLGILTKVPAILDLAAFWSIGYFTLIRDVFNLKQNSKRLKALFTNSSRIILITLGVIVPILLSILYFIVIDAGQEYLQFGLLYNFRYAGSWQLPFDHPVLLFFFSLPGKVVLLALLMAILSALYKKLSPKFVFLATWLMLALIASLLSNRPYPHYFQQLVPPLALLLPFTVLGLAKDVTQKKTKHLFASIISLLLLVMATSAFLLIEFRPYPTLSYYQDWIQMTRGQVSYKEYRNSFNYLMNDNYKVNQVLQQSPDEHLFIWGTNPMLYALSQKIPTGRFTVAFHIKDFDAYNETLADLIEDQPEYVIVMNEDSQNFPALNRYLQEEYVPNYKTYDNFILWRRTPYAN